MAAARRADRADDLDAAHGRQYDPKTQKSRRVRFYAVATIVAREHRGRVAAVIAARDVISQGARHRIVALIALIGVSVYSIYSYREALAEWFPPGLLLPIMAIGVLWLLTWKIGKRKVNPVRFAVIAMVMFSFLWTVAKMMALLYLEGIDGMDSLDIYDWLTILIFLIVIPFELWRKRRAKRVGIGAIPG